MPIDRNLIIRKINLISRDMQKLRPLANLKLEEYLKKDEYEIIAERLFERIIGRIIDINYHLVSETSNSAPKDYFESFTLLSGLKILPYDFAKKLAQLAGLRNRLAHEYNGINEEKIYQSIKDFFNDIPVYLEKIKKFIDNQSKLV
ncbi:MAG: DUF86 domain-containing protein [Patescibacteria group bacterium]